MAKKGNDPFADARKYAGKNSAESIRHGTSVPGQPSIRPHIITPGGRTFSQQWDIPAPGKRKG